MKKIKISIIILLSFAVIISILLYNKSLMKAKTQSNEIDSVPVNIETAKIQAVSDRLELTGNIEAIADVTIIAETQGRVKKVFAEVGDFKSAGSVLYQIDDELQTAAFNSAEVNLKKAEMDFNRFQVLYKQHSITETQFENAKLAYKNAEAQYVKAKRDFSNTKITTPISGIVTSKLIELGDYIKFGNPVANVVDISSLKLKLNVSEKDVFKIKLKDKVEVSTSVYPGVLFEGKVYTIGSKSDNNHNYPVEIKLQNSKTHPLKAGMFGKAAFNFGTDKNLLVIRREALIGSVKDAKVYRIVNGKAVSVKVVIGESFNDYLQVLSGLNEGDTIVVNGQNNLTDGMKVEIIN